jgi:hypothetical protein
VNTERDARKKTLESRIALYEQMEKLCYEEAQRLQAELTAIEDAEAEEDELRWLKRQASFRQEINYGVQT